MNSAVTGLLSLVFWTLVLLLAVALALFAGSNRGSVALAWWPLGLVLELPLYLALLGAALLGGLLGALLAWNAGRRGRREARRRGRRIAVLERELAAARAQLPSPASPTESSVPALPLRRAG